MTAPICVLSVVDPAIDDPPVASALATMGEEFAVDTVAGAEAAVDRLDADRPAVDCVVCVHDRPAGDGSIAATLHDRWPDLPLVLVAGTDQAAITEATFDSGVTDSVRWSPGDDLAAILARRVRTVVSRSADRRDLPLTSTEYAAVLDNVQSGILLVAVDDDEFRYHWCNPQMAEIAGAPAEVIRGQTPRDAFGPDDGAEIERRYRECVRRNEPIEYTVAVQIDGEREFRDAIVRPVATAGELDRLVVTVQEATNRREREAELEESKTRLEALYERSPDMVNLHDADGRIIDPNPRLCEKTGYDEAALRQMYVWELDETIDEAQALSLWQRMDSGDRERREGVYRCEDGSTFPVEAHIRRLDMNGDLRFMVISRDITESTERQRQLERKNERLDEFASVVSHDLRNPLQVLRGALDGAQTTGERAHFDRGQRAVDRMEALVNDILLLARQGDSADQVETVPIREVVERCWETVETEDATLVVETDKRIQVNETRFKQLVENLLGNAIEHGASDATIRVGPLDDGFYVADDGPGIPTAEREQVFEGGYSTAQAGTGFGLAIVERIAEAHDWTVRLTESEAGGARFEFTGVTTV